MKSFVTFTAMVMLSLVVGQAWAQSTARPKVIPFIAEYEQEKLRVLPDGNTLHKVEKGPYYRDSYGRTRLEIGRMIVIGDPVAGTSYILDTQQKVAQVLDHRKLQVMKGKATQVQRVTSDYTKMADPTAVLSAQPKNSPAAESGNRPTVSKRALGSKVIEGVSCEGQIITSVIAANSALGNSRPLETSSEAWMSKELLLPVLAVSEHPLMGKTVQRYTNIRKGVEPDASLFQVPSDYKMIGQ